MACTSVAEMIKTKTFGHTEHLKPARALRKRMDINPEAIKRPDKNKTQSDDRCLRVHEPEILKPNEPLLCCS